MYRKRLAQAPSWMRPLLKLQRKIIGRHPLYDVVAATSQRFISDVFQRCFKAKQFLSTGYPRNDVLFGWPEPGSTSHRLTRVNVDQEVLETVQTARAAGRKVCLYVPTFRKDMAGPFESALDLPRLSAFAQNHNLLVVLKLHPFMHGKYRISRYPHLVEYAPNGDVYPLMAFCDLLITDYSSIFFDFLLLDRPLVFFPYDLKRYLSRDRAMYFDYDAMTPGPKCLTHDELERQIEKMIQDDYRDEYTQMRRKIREYTHDHKDNKSHERLLANI